MIILAGYPPIMRKKRNYLVWLPAGSSAINSTARATPNALNTNRKGWISQDILGAAETNVSATAHGMGHDNEDWGGIPIILMFVDDYQLPPSFSPWDF